MKKLILSLCLLTGLSLNLAAQCPVNAARFRKKLHITPEELYYVSKADMVARYGTADKKLDFPNNHIYDQNGTEMLAKWKSGTKYHLFTCYQIMSRELDSFVLDVPGYTLVTDTGSMAWAQEHMHPAFEGTTKRSLSKYNIVMFYPAGLPIVGKKYKSFIKRAHSFRRQGIDLSIYIVLVPVLKK